MIKITGSVGTSGKYLVTGIPVKTITNAVLKITFENNTSGTNLELDAGSLADFQAGNAGMMLASSGGPGFQFLTIIDTNALAGKHLYVRRKVGTSVSKFTINIE